MDKRKIITLHKNINENILLHKRLRELSWLLFIAMIIILVLILK